MRLRRSQKRSRFFIRASGAMSKAALAKRGGMPVFCLVKPGFQFSDLEFKVRVIHVDLKYPLWAKRRTARARRERPRGLFWISAVNPPEQTGVSRADLLDLTVENRDET